METKYIKYHLHVVPLSKCCSTITQPHEKAFTRLKLHEMNLLRQNGQKQYFHLMYPVKSTKHNT
jgi:hypothetical protein